MIKALEKANKMLGTKSVKASKAKIKARDLAKEWDKILSKAENEFMKYVVKDKSAEKSISNKATTEFDNAVYRNNLRGFKAKKLTMTGGEYFSGSGDNTLLELTGYADLEFTTPKEMTKEEVIEALETMRDDFCTYMNEDTHLVLEGYSPLSTSELNTAIAYEYGLDESAIDNEDLAGEYDVLDETRVSGDFMENGGGFDRILSGGNGKWTVELWINADYILNF